MALVGPIGSKKEEHSGCPAIESVSPQDSCCWIRKPLPQYEHRYLHKRFAVGPEPGIWKKFKKILPGPDPGKPTIWRRNPAAAVKSGAHSFHLEPRGYATNRGAIRLEASCWVSDRQWRGPSIDPEAMCHPVRCQCLGCKQPVRVEQL